MAAAAYPLQLPRALPSAHRAFSLRLEVGRFEHRPPELACFVQSLAQTLLPLVRRYLLLAPPYPTVVSIQKDRMGGTKLLFRVCDRVCYNLTQVFRQVLSVAFRNQGPGPMPTL